MEKFGILAIDDDAEIRKLLAQYLGEDGHRVFTAGNKVEALEALARHPVDIILLDMVLPDTDGLTLLAEIRQRSAAPVIVVSGKGEETDRVVGLEMGADDYITKPFLLREVSARIKAVIRRASAVPPGMQPSVPVADAPLLHFNGWHMDTVRHEVFSPTGEPANLTAGEYNLLKIFLDAPNRALSRDYLFDVTRGNDFDAFDRAIDVQVNRLRRKLKDDPANPALIKTIRGVGYMFIGAVEKSAAPQADTDAAAL